jgi:Uma2 family endonuclease
MTHISAYDSILTVLQSTKIIWRSKQMTPLPRLKTQARFTYADYLTWPDDERWEIIHGVPYNMSPSPDSRHQEVSWQLCQQLGRYLSGKQCKPFAAPFDVRFSTLNQSDNYIETVVQPDIVVICDTSKIDVRGCNGAPDLIIEITSPSTGKNDLTIKFDLYQSYAVKEYWIVHPYEQTVMVFRLQDNGAYGLPERFSYSDKIAVPMLGELAIDLAEVFAS